MALSLSYGLSPVGIPFTWSHALLKKNLKKIGFVYKNNGRACERKLWRKYRAGGTCWYSPDPEICPPARVENRVLWCKPHVFTAQQALGLTVGHQDFFWDLEKPVCHDGFPLPLPTTSSSHYHHRKPWCAEAVAAAGREQPGLGEDSWWDKGVLQVLKTLNYFWGLPGAPGWIGNMTQ